MRRNQDVRFIKSAVKTDQFPRHSLPEIAFIGRSNVGKSSLLNALANKKTLARISNTPGRTQLINFFDIHGKLCFVDLPGYGFAQVPEHVKKHWQPMIEAYLLKSEALRAVVLIVDARHKPSRHDIMMREWLQCYEIPVLIVATKIDKVPKTRRSKHLKRVRETLKLQSAETLLPFSALNGEGLKAVWQAVVRMTLSSAPL
ncbi:YihA family ribosome biogenesis GTP-binding protein [candidate division KSB3 bacterium]|uniref:Probable GTP-binding protein EngB n=1 Tax=candidate division KSB3 bacterium TaxID=2044937 RepID=A0A2G6E590_9BACT|nr:MAG: YihA family ribosome biogenesis GTP-binding protein [candidate division KSB3 bacterium]PIE29661.1 MAG: YihA family ribosome biogenesis GTP-binding protein [candidate division KSB3 bacterium]